MGISGTADLFQVPLERESEEILESPVVEVKTSYASEKGKSQRSRKRKREASPNFDEPRPRLTASDLVSTILTNGSLLKATEIDRRAKGLL